MSRFASGKDAWGISDRSGFRYRLRDMKKEWNGLLVGKDEFEEKHPQLEPIHVPADPQAIKDPRPDRSEPKVEVLLKLHPFSSAVGTNVITVTEPGHGRATDDVVRFRKAVGFAGITSANINKAAGYSITKVNADTYTFNVDGSAATVTLRGGGKVASAGPVTVEA